MIKNNVTKIINPKKINEQIGYAMLSFGEKDELTKNTKIYKEKINIGRSCENDIVVSDLTVSRQQCLIVKKGYKSKQVLLLMMTQNADKKREQVQLLR